MDRRAWWQSAVIYQIYPRSFQDGNGDGVGDLRGILRRLDYLCELGVDAVWISPIFPSPMADFGYDVSDYIGDRSALRHARRSFDALLAAAHARGLRILLDFVPNHTSDRHPWFLESRASRQSPRRDWYIWRDPAPDGGPPNNWLSAFGGQRVGAGRRAPASTTTTPSWPRSPISTGATRRCAPRCTSVMRFWLRRGVDGFRVDVIWHLLKDDQFRDNPAEPGLPAGPAAGPRGAPGLHDRPARRCTRSSRGCGAWSTSSRTGC